LYACCRQGIGLLWQSTADAILLPGLSQWMTNPEKRDERLICHLESE
jgi:hypothetical protein